MKKYELLPTPDNINESLEKNSLNRNISLSQMAKLLNGIDENTIISIDGDWGVGKTFFIKQFLYLNENENLSHKYSDIDQSEFEKYSDSHINIYYNAWQNDDHVEPIKSLIFNILNEFPKYENEISNSKELYDSAKPILINILDKLTHGIITKECFENLNSFADLAKEIYTVDETKKSLNKLLELITQKRRITLIIDELDRCKPDYAIKMLETIKNFYINDKLTILVVTNNKQLSHTVKKFYGESFDGMSYLHKIYDNSIYLRVDNIKNYLSDYFQICQRTYLPEDVSFLLLTHFNFSLREINKYITMYNIWKKQIEFEDIFDKERSSINNMFLIPFTLILKIHDEDSFQKLISGNGEEIIRKFIKFIENSSFDKDYVGWFKRSLFKVDEGNLLANVVIEKYKQYLKDRDNSIMNFNEVVSILDRNANYEI